MTHHLVPPPPSSVPAVGKTDVHSESLPDVSVEQSHELVEHDPGRAATDGAFMSSDEDLAGISCIIRHITSVIVHLNCNVQLLFIDITNAVLYTCAKA